MPVLSRQWEPQFGGQARGKLNGRVETADAVDDVESRRIRGVKYDTASREVPHRRGARQGASAARAD